MRIKNQRSRKTSRSFLLSLPMPSGTWAVALVGLPS